MPDYGHDLLFGSFITPSNADPQVPVKLAQVSERAGLDLATFQDHPYQPGFHDTWTLLSYVAARTETIHLAPNVANLPLRQPAVLARSAASLDLLSGGRIELGLGAGGFWDAIEAMGAPRRTPGESVQALTEAIEIIRAIWAADERGGVRVNGEFHHATGAKRGPAPAHDIEIWLGAYKPRMLALIGAKADGWLPSLGYLQPGDLARGNARIDAAATEAGRAPHEIRRLLNISGQFTERASGLLVGPVAQWVEELTELALIDGMGTFILGSDDLVALERFGSEVAPAVREAVAAERAGRATPSAPTQPAPSAQPASVWDEDAHSTAVTGSAPVPSADAAINEYERLGVIPTPDDGVRLSSESVLAEDSRPMRPESAPDVTYSERGKAAGQHLIDVHDQLRAELTEVRSLVRQVRDGAISAGAARSVINELTMRQNNWTLGAYCSSYCRIVTQHHSLEDEGIFPHLASAEPALEPVIDRLAEEHLVIHEVLEGVDRALVALVAKPGDVSGLEEAVNLLSDVLLSHFAYEEQQLVEPLARHGFYANQI